LYNIDYPTFQCKQSKPYRIVIGGLHPLTNITDIKEELAKAGHEVIRIFNVIIKKKIDMSLTKIALPLFFVDLITKQTIKTPII